MNNAENKETQKGQQMDKLSERMIFEANNNPHYIDDDMMRELAKDVAQLEAENKELQKELEELRVEGARHDDTVWDRTDRTVLEAGGE